MAEVRYHRLAYRDLVRAAAWYSKKRDAALAERFLAQVDDVLVTIGAAPGIGSIVDPKARQFKVSRFPYKIVYDINGPDDVLVMAVAHTSRRPGYWKRRRSRP